MNKKIYKIIIFIAAVATLLLGGIWLFGSDYFLNKYYKLPPSAQIVSVNEKSSYEIIKGDTFNTYINTKYGFEFRYPKDFILDTANYSSDNVSIGIYENRKEDTKSLGRILISHQEGAYNNPPKNESVKNWVLKDSEYPIDVSTVHGGQFNYAIGPEISLGEKETLHLYTHSNSGGYFDNFYFINNGKMFIITIEEPYDTDPKTGYLTYKDLDLKSNQWYVGVLKSLKFK